MLISGGLFLVPCGAHGSTSTCRNLTKGFSQKLAHRRAEARQLIVHFCVVARAVHAKQGDVTVEWPRNCLGWKSQTLVDLLSDLKCESSTCCQLDVVDKTGRPLLKPWRFDPTSSRLCSVLATYKCSKSHTHGVVSGQAAAPSGFYPEKLATLILEALYNKDVHARCLVPTA